MLPEYRTENHLDVLLKGIVMVMVIITIEPHLVGIDDGIVILDRNLLRIARITGGAAGGDILGDHLVFETVLQGCRAGDSGAEFQHVAVGASEFIGIARNIGPRAHETHLPAKDIPEARQLVEFRVA